MDKQLEDFRLQIDELEHKARFDDIVELCELKLADPNPDIVITAMIGLRTATFGRGDFASARKYSADALLLAREQASPEVLVEALCDAAFLRAQEWKLDAEMTVLAQEALSLAQAHNYKRGIAFATCCLGYSISILGSKADALRYLEQAISLAQELHELDLEANASGVLANFFAQTRKFDQAVKYNLRTLSLNRQAGNDISRCVTLSNLASCTFTSVYHFRSYEQAIAYNEEALALSRQLGYGYGQLCALAGLSTSYVITGQAEKALPVLEELVTLSHQYGSVTYEKDALSKLGMAYSKLKNYASASASLERQVSLANPAEYAPWDIRAHYQIGNVNLKWGHYQEAIDAWRVALAFHKLYKKRGAGYYISLLSFYPYFAYCQVRIAMKRLPRVVIR